MKMTDEIALAAVHKALRQVPMKDGDADWFAAQDAYEHLRSRLAADQQKGGGEVNPWQAAVDEGRVVAHLGIAADGVTREEAIRQLGELIDWHVAVALDPAVNGGFVLTPQPSIPAPAQQLVDEAVAADNYRWLRCGGWEVLQDPKYWRPEYGFDGAIAAARADVATNAALAHPPHADSPAQQDGKASGGEATDAMAEAMLAALNDPFNQWHTQIDRMKIAYRAAYLAHPPHADQETQG